MKKRDYKRPFHKVSEVKSCMAYAYLKYSKDTLFVEGTHQVTPKGSTSPCGRHHNTGPYPTLFENCVGSFGCPETAFH